MSKTPSSSADFIAAKFSIYDRVLAALLKSSPHAEEIEREVRDLVEYWRTEFADSPLLVETGVKTLQSLFSPES